MNDFLSGDVFHFKNFSMRQAPSGQRVNTDSCVFGGVIGRNENPRRILDIGAGSGVLTLMLATRFAQAQLVAIEPENDILDIARENFSQTIWKNRISSYAVKAQDVTAEAYGTFDMILCNPPYFQNSLKSSDRQRATARHNTDLGITEIYSSMIEVSTQTSTMWVSFPEADGQMWLFEAKKMGLFPFEVITTSDHPEALPHLKIVGFSKHEPSHSIQETIYYRKFRMGPMSDWMRLFREEWYPERFNRFE